MNKITAIEAQQKRSNRRSIFVDGEFVAGAHESVVVALGLAVGQVFDKDRLVELLKAETKRKAMDSAFRLLSFRDRSITEIRRRLGGNDFPEEIVEEVIEQLIRLDYLDDERFSRSWVKSRTQSKPMGRHRLAYELRTKGVDANSVEEALGQLDEDTEFNLALSIARNKAQKMVSGDPSFKNRIISFLRRRGFGWDVITRVLDALEN